MVKIKINDTTYKVPERWTIEQWTKLQTYDITDSAYHRYIINLATGIPMNTFGPEHEEQVMLAVGFIAGSLNNRVVVELPDFEKLTFGEFVDLDCFIALGVEKYIDKVLEILKIESQWADECLYVIEQYILWRNNIYMQFKQLFGIDDKDFEAFEEDYDGPKDPMSVARGWYSIMVDLANDDLLKLDAIAEEPLKKVLTFMNYRKEKALKEAEALRQLRNKQTV